MQLLRFVHSTYMVNCLGSFSYCWSTTDKSPLFAARRNGCLFFFSLSLFFSESTPQTFFFSLRMSPRCALREDPLRHRFTFLLHFRSATEVLRQNPPLRFLLLSVKRPPFILPTPYMRSSPSPSFLCVIINFHRFSCVRSILSFRQCFNRVVGAFQLYRTFSPLVEHPQSSSFRCFLPTSG